MNMRGDIKRGNELAKGYTPRRFIARTVPAVLALVMLIQSGCTGFSGKRDGFSGNLSIRVSDSGGRAFAAEYYWNGDVSEDALIITVPDEFKGTQVTSLGGYIGTGVPTPFRIVPSTQHPEKPETEHADFLAYGSYEPDSARQVSLEFTLNIGKNIKTINSVVGGKFAIRAEDGSVTEYTIGFCVKCAEDNPTFYSKDGVLYRRSDDSRVEEIPTISADHSETD